MAITAPVDSTILTIYLSLPEGREVNIGRTPQNDERYADIDYALNDAFKRARRQLQVSRYARCRAK